MRVRVLAILVLSGLVPIATLGAEEVPVAVMEFASKGGIEQNQMDALSDMLANEIRGLGNYKVISKSDIRAALQMEEQKALLGCSDESCVAEIGGALGVRFVVVGNISLFGRTYLLNLKLMNVESVSVVNSISKTIKGEPDGLIDLLPKATRQLFVGARKELWPDGVKPKKLDQPQAVPSKGGWGAVKPDPVQPEKPPPPTEAAPPEPAPPPPPEPDREKKLTPVKPPKPVARPDGSVGEWKQVPPDSPSKQDDQDEE